ncbi:MAG: SUMF1/EgtB/PvdO family nonheme iron enzyme [Candidatus Competibacteraceae bacterium]|nr:SUMF1/EgtB/PvdO family nonheme iron enzyme [Candidatus Competibacteraceae bacterium]
MAVGDQWTDLVREKRAILLLDGLNEIPVAQREQKTKQIEQLLRQHENLPCILSCRVRDYQNRLDDRLDSLTIHPLSARGIRQFIGQYMEAMQVAELTAAEVSEQAEQLFWNLAGGRDLQALWHVWQGCGASFEQFFEAKSVPQAVSRRTSWTQHSLWRAYVRNPASLLQLARTPYFLTLLLLVYQREGEFPRNRAMLFTDYVQSLLARTQDLLGVTMLDDAGHYTAQGEALLKALGDLAWAMQTQRQVENVNALETVQVALNLPDARKYLNDDQLQLARHADLLEIGERVRFRHQLLQEYFVAIGMRQRLSDDTLDAKTLWPEPWLRTGWEEAAVMLVGLDDAEFETVVLWLADAQPEVAADCIKRAGLSVSDELLKQLRAVWLPHLSDTKNFPHPSARAAYGRALGSLTLDGRPLDNRTGVWSVYLAEEQRAEISIDWVKISGGAFIYQDGETRELETFYLARYPITHSQFQAFIDDPNGYTNPRWWTDLEQPDAPVEAERAYANHPRETVNWYEALAYCRWLSTQLGYVVTLPTEQQWERAARGRKGRAYPWGETYRKGYANIVEGESGYSLYYSRVVGTYPQGASYDEGVCDLAGNVWEWCLTQYDNPAVIAPHPSGELCVVRGGSWSHDRPFACGMYCRRNRPFSRFDDMGFRLSCVSPYPDQ